MPYRKNIVKLLRSNPHAPSRYWITGKMAPLRCSSPPLACDCAGIGRPFLWREPTSLLTFAVYTPHTSWPSRGRAPTMGVWLAPPGGWLLWFRGPLVALRGHTRAHTPPSPPPHTPPAHP